MPSSSLKVIVGVNDTLKKFDKLGNCFEEVVIMEGKPAYVKYRRLGEPAESYARGLPYIPEK